MKYLVLSLLASLVVQAEEPPPQAEETPVITPIVTENIFVKTGGDVWLNKRASASPLFGIILNDAYTNVIEFGAAFNYNLSQRSALELTFLMASASDTDPVSSYIIRNSQALNHNYAKMFVGAGYAYTLMTSTINLNDSKKIPWLLRVTPGVGFTSLTSAAYSPPPNYPPVAVSQMAITGALDIDQEFFLNDRLALRVDLKNHIYNENIYGANNGTFDHSHLNINTGIMVGATWYCVPHSSKFDLGDCF